MHWGGWRVCSAFLCFVSKWGQTVESYCLTFCRIILLMLTMNNSDSLHIRVSSHVIHNIFISLKSDFIAADASIFHI